LAGIAALALLTLGCGRETEIDFDDDSDTGTDIDSDTDSDSDTDTDVDTSGPEPMWDCVPPDDEGDEDPCALYYDDPDAFCFAWAGAPGGFCTRECTAATYEVPVQDGCPSFDGYVCMDISAHTADPVDDEEGYAICVEECLPKPLGQEGPCKASYQSCNPLAWAWESQWATCLLPKCQSDADCLMASGPTCTGDGECNTAEGETCSDDGFCVFEADCDTASGRCTWEAGNEDAEPGDPCHDAHDCGANSVCLQPEVMGDGTTAYANGYCTSFGCKAANVAAPNGSGSADPAIQDELACGMLGTCHAGFDMGGLCTKRCNPPHDQDAFKCRQQSWDSEFLDENGDYECYDDTGYGYPIWTTGNTELYLMAPAPGCVPPRSCDGECDTPYVCRDPETGAPSDDGYCLDETTSGPTESW